MHEGIDAGVYPERVPPEALATLEEKADYLHRICAAFDHGVVPEEATLRLLSGWQEVFDRFPLPGLPSYHALRSYFGWQQTARWPYFMEPAYVKLDRIEGREDGFEDRL